MQRLGETVARLRRVRGSDDAGAPTVRFQTTAGFGPNPGQLRMAAYAPPGLVRGRPLVVVLHGCTQSPEGYAAAAGWVDLAGQRQFAILAPEQSRANNPNRCFNWFVPGDIARGGGEAASIASMVGRAVKDFGSDPSQVFITGLSAGGAMTAVMLATYPELFAGGAIVAGLPFGAALGAGEAVQAMFRPNLGEARALAGLVRRAAPAGASPPPLAIWHGDADTTVHVSNGEALARQWAGLHHLPAEPDETTAFPSFRRSVWRAGGRVVLELNIVFGLGHGAPVSTVGSDPLGAVAPFVLEAGVSSTREIARFWGLAPGAEATPEAWPPAAERRPGPWARPAEASRLGERVVGAVSPHVSASVADAIAKALRAAGLMG